MRRGAGQQSLSRSEEDASVARHTCRRAHAQGVASDSGPRALGPSRGRADGDQTAALDAAQSQRRCGAGHFTPHGSMRAVRGGSTVRVRPRPAHSSCHDRSRRFTPRERRSCRSASLCERGRAPKVARLCEPQPRAAEQRVKAPHVDASPSRERLAAPRRPSPPRRAAPRRAPRAAARRKTSRRAPRKRRRARRRAAARAARTASYATRRGRGQAPPRGEGK